MQWWSDYFEDVDTMDADRFGMWFAEDITLHFNNHPPILGREAVLGFLKSFTLNFKKLRHRHGDLIGDTDRAAGEAIITFTRNDDQEFEVRGVTMVTRKEGLFSRMAIYADFSDLY
ncbi:nuclear transport factor 2 family protein [Novosphingobium sp. B 225]|uniref:nuclear transport factor 2 family protein n=1 Tax=Novosphingobium sp. B 225 TaxID=1961849 RepID=UPI000B4AD143|nr:nuclear transport factor 2 family protein [Novosphingobium sp. B 225]